jgi:dihydroorotase
MPNLQPPITKVSDAVSYHRRLSRLAPGVTFLMSLFLHPSLDAATVAEAARTKIIHGVYIRRVHTKPSNLNVLYHIPAVLYVLFLEGFVC